MQSMEPNRTGMPKAFSRAEKSKIRAQLMRIGLEHFARGGVRAARVDDICREVGIAKGSFYAFFQSKEDLFMTIADERDEQHKADMMDWLHSAGTDQRAVLGGFFDFMLERIDTDPVLAIVRDIGEINHLIRRVPAERLAENTRRDLEFMVRVAELFQRRLGIIYADKTTLEGLLTLMLSMSLQDEHLKSAGVHTSTVVLMRDLFLSRLLRGPLDA